MSVENRGGIGGILGDFRDVGNIVHKLLVSYAADLTKKCIPGITLGVEEDQRIAEQARKNLDSAYGLLGGETGEDVSLDQIAEVLRAEKQVAQYSPDDSTIAVPVPNALFTKEALEAIQLTTTVGLHGMSLMMHCKADDLERIHQAQSVKGDPDSKLAETQRRAKACKAAEKFLGEELRMKRSSFYD